MTIEVRDGRFFSRWYFAGATDVPFDVMAAVWKDSEVNHWDAMYRFRYHNDKNVFDSTDEKRWYSIRFPEEMNEASVLRSFGDTLLTACEAAGLEVQIITVQSDNAEHVMEILSRESWLRLKSIEEIRR
jgi:hypothetical protein